MTADHPGGYLVVAGGDLKLNGDSEMGAENFAGTAYGGSQCEVSGKPKINGSLQCANKPDPSGVKNLVDENKISGDMILNTPCSGSSSSIVTAVFGRGWAQVSN